MNQIAQRIIYDRYSRNYCLNNYTPPQWWECDVFELTRSGFFREYEIKANRGDFFADAKKYSRTYNWEDRTSDDTYKHSELERRSTKGPSRFYYVVPYGLIELNEIPEWA